MNEQPAILAQGLSKNYAYFEKEEGLRGSLKALFARKMKLRQAVSDFTFTLEKGQILGLIGPNGAGKTTLIKMLTGIIQPSAGKVSVLDFNPATSNEAFRKQFALVMGQKSQLWWDLPAVDTFLLNQAIYEIPEAEFRSRMGMLVELFEVKHLLQIPVRQLSLGERMKMELIASLLHSPKILFLDEPTIGLDAIAQRQIRDLVRLVNQVNNVTVLLTSHYMEDIRNLCDNILVIRKGQKIYDGRLDLLLNQAMERMTVNLRYTSLNGWNPPTDVQYLERSPLVLRASMPRERVRSFMQEALHGGEVADLSVTEEDMGSLVEKIYSMEGETDHESVE